MQTDPELEALLRRLAPQVLGAVVRRYGHFDLAEDAVQEARLAAGAGDTMLPGPMTVGELADVAALLASDRARGATGTVIYVSRGAVLD